MNYLIIFTVVSIVYYPFVFGPLGAAQIGILTSAFFLRIYGINLRKNSFIILYISCLFFASLLLGTQLSILLRLPIYLYVFLTFARYVLIHPDELRLGVLVGLVLLNLHYFVLGESQNSVAYSTIIFAPFLFVGSSQNTFRMILLWLLVLGAMLFNGSRTGVILIGLEFVSYLFIVSQRKTFSILIIVVVALGFIFSPLTSFLQEANSEFYETVSNVNEVRHNDQSILQRLAQYRKTASILHERPFFGVGLGNYTVFSIDFNVDDLSDSTSVRNYKHRSAHSTYLQVFSEQGLLLAIPFFAFVFLLLKFSVASFIEGYKSCAYGVKVATALSLISMLVYWSVISQFLGAMTWLILGVSYNLLKFKN